MTVTLGVGCGLEMTEASGFRGHLRGPQGHSSVESSDFRDTSYQCSKIGGIEEVCKRRRVLVKALMACYFKRRERSTHSWWFRD